MNDNILKLATPIIRKKLIGRNESVGTVIMRAPLVADMMALGDADLNHIATAVKLLAAITNLDEIEIASLEMSEFTVLTTRLTKLLEGGG